MMGVTTASDVQLDMQRMMQEIAQELRQDSEGFAALLEIVEELKKDFETTAILLDKHYSNVNVARVSGGVGGVIGGGLAVGGAIAAPFTLGVSLVLTIVGASIGVAGGATSGGAVITRHFIERKHLKAVQAKWDKFQDLCQRMAHMPMPPTETTGTQVERVAMVMRMVTNFADAVVDSTVTPLTAVGAQAAISAPRLAFRVVSSPLFVLSLVSVGLSVFDIVAGSRELHKQTGSPAGDTCRKLVNSLDKLSQQLSSSTLLSDLE